MVKKLHKDTDNKIQYFIQFLLTTVQTKSNLPIVISKTLHFWSPGTFRVFEIIFQIKAKAKEYHLVLKISLPDIDEFMWTASVKERYL